MDDCEHQLCSGLAALFWFARWHFLKPYQITLTVNGLFFANPYRWATQRLNPLSVQKICLSKINTSPVALAVLTYGMLSKALTVVAVLVVAMYSCSNPRCSAVVWNQSWTRWVSRVSCRLPPETSACRVRPSVFSAAGCGAPAPSQGEFHPEHTFPLQCVLAAQFSWSTWKL